MMTHHLPIKKCFTIGYGDYPIEVFLYFLQKMGIDTIIDVRSSPYSNYNPSFNRGNLEKSLIQNHIEYRYLGDKIGGRYSDSRLLLPDGTVDYLKVQSTEHFQAGISQVLSIISTGKKVALMCAEKEPEKCHRFVLISRVLQVNGVAVIHVRPQIRLQTNEELEKELINSLVDTRQVTLSGESVNPVESMYERLTKKLAYKSKVYMAPIEENAGLEIPEEVQSIHPVEEKEDRVCDLSSECEPAQSSDQVTDISPGSDSSRGTHTKKHIQHRLL